MRYQSGGTATEAFVHFASLTPPYVPSAVHVGVVSPGGVYEDQLVVSSTASTFPVGVKIAVAPDGAAVAAWTEALGSLEGPERYRAAYRPAGSDEWEAPFTIAADEERAPSKEAGGQNLVPAISASGTAAVGVEHLASKEVGTGGQRVDRIDVAVHPAGGGWSSQRISPADTSDEDLSLAIDAGGDLTAAYQQRYAEIGKFKEHLDRYQVLTRRLTASSGIWAPEEALSSGSTTNASDVRLGLNEGGDAVIAWQLYDSATETIDTEAVTRSGASGSWTAAAPIVVGGSNSNPLAAAVAPDGNAYVLYAYSSSSGSSDDCVGAVRAPVQHAFYAQKCASPDNENGISGSIAFRESNAYMVWAASTPGESRETVQAAIWPDGKIEPEATSNLDVPDMHYGPPTIVGDGEGSLVAFYTLYSSESTQLRAAAYDASPPILTGSSIPTTATAGVPVTFGASFADLWSELAAGQPTWSFGDGSAPEAGASVTHTFANAGTYTITLAASDVLGNTANSTYRIVVTPSQVSPPPPIAHPSISLDRPICKRKLSKAACRRFKSSPGAWRTLSGSVSDSGSTITRVQVAVYRIHRRHIESLHGGRFHKSTMKQAAKRFVVARVQKGHWSLHLPKLIAANYTIIVWATDEAGKEAQLLAKVTLK